MSQEKINMLVIGIVVVIAFFGVFATVAQVIPSVDTAGLSSQVAYVVEFVKYVVIATPVAILFGYSRNISGYVFNWFRSKRSGIPNADYSLKWMSQTVVQFEAVILIATPLVNMTVSLIMQQWKPEYMQESMMVIAAVWALIDMMISELKRALSEAKKPS